MAWGMSFAQLEAWLPRVSLWIDAHTASGQNQGINKDY